MSDAAPPDSGAPAPAADESFADLLERARALAPIVEAEAEASERAGTLTPKTVAAIREARLVRAFLPRELGGLECAPTELVALVEEVARQDGSTGWCVGMNGVIGGIASAGLSDAGAERVFGGRPAGETLMAGGYPPQGRSVREGAGWRVSGHFRFGSGCRHADFMVCTALEIVDGEPVMAGKVPRMRSFVLPTDLVELVDNWDVSGLQGTASCDYLLEERYVDDEMSFVSSDLQPQRGRSLYRIPLLSIANAPHAGFALGVGRRALEEISTHATWRQRLGSAAALADRPSFQQGLARAGARLRSARAWVVETLEAIAESTASESGASLRARADATAATTNAYEASLDATRFAFRAAGGSALFRSNRLQRCLRDIEAGSQHMVVSDESWERVGQVWLGVGEPTMI